jgi:hypothetical protein
MKKISIKTAILLIVCFFSFPNARSAIEATWFMISDPFIGVGYSHSLTTAITYKLSLGYSQHSMYAETLRRNACITFNLGKRLMERSFVSLNLNAILGERVTFFDKSHRAIIVDHQTVYPYKSYYEHASLFGLGPTIAIPIFTRLFIDFSAMPFLHIIWNQRPATTDWNDNLYDAAPRSETKLQILLGINVGLGYNF